MELFQALLIALVAAIGQFTGDAVGGIMINRPLVLGPLVGFVLGDLTQGVIIGAALELIFLGVVSIGGATPSDSNMGAVLGTAFAMSMNQGVEIALALAVPIGLLSQMVRYLIYFFRSTTMYKVDEYAEKGQFKKITVLHFGHALSCAILMGCIAFFSFYFGAGQMESLVNSIPEVVINGLGVASKMLPAVGFALLMNMLWNKQLAVFLLFGFILSAYLELPIVAIAGIALTIGVIMIIQDSKVKTPVTTVDDTSKNEEEVFFSE